jgi:hypothetical protein
MQAWGTAICGGMQMLWFDQEPKLPGLDTDRGREMKCGAVVFTLVLMAALACVTDAWAAKRASRTERIKQYTQTYQSTCKPQLICTPDCQDLYDLLHREGIDVGGPCKPSQ